MVRSNAREKCLLRLQSRSDENFNAWKKNPSSSSRGISVKRSGITISTSHENFISSQRAALINPHYFDISHAILPSAFTVFFRINISMNRRAVDSFILPIKVYAFRGHLLRETGGNSRHISRGASLFPSRACQVNSQGEDSFSSWRKRACGAPTARGRRLPKFQGETCQVLHTRGHVHHVTTYSSALCPLQ